MINYITNSLPEDAKNLQLEVNKVSKLASMLKEKCSVIQDASNEQTHISLAKWVGEQANDINTALEEIQNKIHRIINISNKCLNNETVFEEKYY